MKPGFGYSNSFDLSSLGPIDPVELCGYAIYSAAEYTQATPLSLIDLSSIRQSIQAAIKSGDLAKAIAEYEEYKNKQPDDGMETNGTNLGWEIAIRFPAKGIRVDNREVPTFIEVKTFSKEFKFKTLGFAVYRDVGTGIIDTEPQKLAVVHLTKAH